VIDIGPEQCHREEGQPEYGGVHGYRLVPISIPGRGLFFKERQIDDKQDPCEIGSPDRKAQSTAFLPFPLDLGKCLVVFIDINLDSPYIPTSRAYELLRRGCLSKRRSFSGRSVVSKLMAIRLLCLRPLFGQR